MPVESCSTLKLSIQMYEVVTQLDRTQRVVFVHGAVFIIKLKAFSIQKIVLYHLR